MADEQIGIDILLNSGEAATSVRELKQSIRDLQGEALKAGAAGDDALAAKFTAAAGKARDRMADLNREINAMQDTGSKIQAVTGLAQSLAGGFAGAAGAAALFGNSQEEIQKQLLKVQAATAVLMGVQGLADGLKQAGIVKNIALQEIQIAQTKLQTAAEEGGVAVRYAATAAQWLLNAAMNANPVLLLITGITTLVAALASFDSASERAAKTQKRLNDAMEMQEKILDKVIGKLKDEQLIRFNSANQLERELDLAKASGESKEKLYLRERRILEEKIKDWEVQKAAILSLRNLTAEEYDFNNKLYNDLKVLDAQRNTDVRESLAEQKKIRDEAAQKQKEETTARIAESERINQEARSAKEIQEQEYQKQQDEKDFAAEVEKSEKDKKEIAAAIQLYNEQKKLREKDAKEKIETEQKIRDAKLSIAQSSVNGLAALGKLAGLQGAAAVGLQKGLATVQIAIDTAKAISSAIAGATAAAAAGGPAAPFLIAGYVATGVASVLTAMATAKELLSSAGGTPPPTPSFDTGTGSPQPQQITQQATPIGNTSTQIATSGSNQQPMIVKAYVVESEITTTQEQVKFIEDKSKF